MTEIASGQHANRKFMDLVFEGPLKGAVSLPLFD